MRDKRQTIYCYSGGRAASGPGQAGRSAEITRFKGLGEISPTEFKAFIGPDIRLTPSRRSQDTLDEIIEFYMGNNTQERRDYIMQNLTIDREAV